LSNTNFWFTVPGSTATNHLIITMDPAQTNVFYRMVYPQMISSGLQQYLLVKPAAPKPCLLAGRERQARIGHGGRHPLALGSDA
jgi:hypothetical protein